MRSLLTVALFVACLILSPTNRGQQQNPTDTKKDSPTVAPSLSLVLPTLSQQNGSSPKKETSIEEKTTDWPYWFWPPIWSNWALVIAAIWAGCIALKTFKAIRVQSKANLKSARAAKKTADSLINIERPWLLVTAVERHDFFELTDVGTTRVSGARFVVKNYGKSPAWIVAMGGSFVTINKLSDLPPEPEYKTVRESREQGIVVVPMAIETDSQAFSFPHESNSVLTHDQFTLAFKQKVIWCVYGFVRYVDAFNEERETRFCHTLTSDNSFSPANAGSAYTYHR